jgi:hypothetical protein
MPHDVIVWCRDPNGVKPKIVDLDEIPPPVQLAEHLLLYGDPRPITPIWFVEYHPYRDRPDVREHWKVPEEQMHALCRHYGQTPPSVPSPARKPRKTKEPTDPPTIAEAVEKMVIHNEHRRKWKAIALLKLIDQRMQESEEESGLPLFISNDDIRLNCHNKSGLRSRAALLKIGESAIKDTILEGRDMAGYYRLPIELEQVAHRGLVVKERTTTGRGPPENLTRNLT